MAMADINESHVSKLTNEGLFERRRRKIDALKDPETEVKAHDHLKKDLTGIEVEMIERKLVIDSSEALFDLYMLRVSDLVSDNAKKYYERVVAPSQ